MHERIWRFNNRFHPQDNILYIFSFRTTLSPDRILENLITWTDCILKCILWSKNYPLLYISSLITLARFYAWPCWSNIISAFKTLRKIVYVIFHSNLDLLIYLITLVKQARALVVDLPTSSPYKFRPDFVLTSAYI